MFNSSMYDPIGLISPHHPQRQTHLPRHNKVKVEVGRDCTASHSAAVDHVVRLPEGVS